MNYKIYTDKISEILNEFKTDVDSLAINYCRQKKEHEDVIKKGLLSEKGIENLKTDFQMNIVNHTSDVLSKLRNKYTEPVNKCIDGINYEIDSYFNSPLNKELADKIQSIKILGIMPKDKEIDLLADSVCSYYDMRLLASISENTDNNNLANVPMNRISKFNELPDIDSIYQSFNEYKSCINDCINLYCGNEVALKDCMTESAYYNPLSINPTLSLLRGESYYNGKVEERFVNNLSKCNEIIKKDRGVTDLERRYIDALIEPNKNYPSLLKNYIKTLAENDTYICELIKKDGRYSEYI